MDVKKLIHDRIRAQDKALSTAEQYTHWTTRFLDYCKAKKIGKETKAEDAVERFLSDLANVQNVASKTQNQAFSALCYFYKECLKRPLVNVSALRAKNGSTVREVVDQSEIVAIFKELSGIPLLCARMMYGCNFRIGELGNLRIKDISFERKQITVRGGKGKKDRLVGFPEVLHASVARQIESMRVLHSHDQAEGLNGVSLPYAWSRKSPSSHMSFTWWYLFTADDYSKCPHTGKLFRHHRDMGHVSRQIKNAVERAGIDKRITSHCLRHSFATHSLESGVPIHVIQALMGHTSIETTQTYLHVSKDGPTSAKSPLESLSVPPLEDMLRNPPVREHEAKTEKFIPRLYTGTDG
jgi:integron integrase